MAKKGYKTAKENAVLLVFSNPVSAEREAEYNKWYNNVHCKEVTSLAGFTNAARYRVVAQVVPPGVEPAYRYLALFGLSDPQVAVQSLMKGATEFKMSPAIDLAGSQVVAFENIHATHGKMLYEKAVLLVLSNPVSVECEAEYNEWYNNVHCREVTSFAGFTNAARYRIVAQVMPPEVAPAYRYLALFGLSDPQVAVQSLMKGASEFKMSPAIDLAGSQVVAFEKIF